jgi:diguanylate cyclase (GGDEF)-like protein/PAS domain S-box-containing protein
MLAIGWGPLGPLAWPGLGLILAAAFWGASGAIGAAIVTFGYYLWTLGAPQRFPHFFAHPEMLVFWVIGLSLAAIAAGALRARLLRAQALALEAAKSDTELLALRDYKTWLNSIIDNAPALIGYIDAEQRVQFNNVEFENWLGKPKSEISGRPLRDVFGEAEYRKLQPQLERALRGNHVTFHLEHAWRGETRHAQTSYVPDFDPRGRVRGCFVVAKDISAVVEAQRGPHDELRGHQQALRATGVQLWDADVQAGNVEDMLLQVHPDDRDAAGRGLLEALKGSGSYAAEHRMRAAGGEWRWVLTRGRVMQRDPASGRALRLIGAHIDIHERKLAEQALERRVEDDERADLATQSLLIERLRRALARSERSGAPLSLMHLDIDRFKPLADSLGAPASEALLKEIGTRLRACVRVTDTVARVGIDQFVVLLEDLKQRSDAFKVAEKMLHALREPAAAGGREVRLTASIGVAFPEGADAAPEELVKRAGSALEAAKSAGRDAYRST